MTNYNDVTQNACISDKKREKGSVVMTRNSSKQYDFGREHEVPLQRYAEPPNVSDKQRDPWYKMFVKSHVVCILLLLAITLVAMFILLYTALFTREQSLTYLKVAGVTFALTLVFFQPGVFFIALMLGKASLQVDRKTTADELAKDSQREMRIGFAGLQTGHLFLKKTLGSGTLHWRRKYGSVVILNTFNRKHKAETENTSENNNVNMGLLLVLAVIVGIFTSIQVGFKHRKNQSVFNVELLGVSSSLDEAFDMDEFWKHIKNVYNTLRDTRGRLDMTQDVSLLSSIRLRQMRRSKEKRDCPEFQIKTHPFCRHDDDYTFDDVDYVGSWEQIGSDTNPNPTPFRYKPPDSFVSNLPLVGDRVQTQKYDYPSGGYDYILALESDDTKLFDRLETLSWVDGRTQLVRLDFTIFMPDTGLTTNFVVTYDFSAIAIFQETFAYTYFMFDGFRDELLLYAIVFFGILILFLMRRQFVFVLSNGLKSCVTSKESIIRMVEILAAVILITTYIAIRVTADNLSEELKQVYIEREELTTYVDFRPLAKWDKDVMVSIEITLATIILLHLLVQSSRFPRLRGLAYIATNVQRVLILPVVTLLCFELTGKLLFSTRSLEFADRGQFFNAFRLTLWASRSLPKIRDRPPITPDHIANSYWYVLKSASDFIVMNFFIIVITDLIEKFKNENENVKQARLKQKKEPLWRRIKIRIISLVFRKKRKDSQRKQAEKGDNIHAPRRYSRRRSLQAEWKWTYQNQFFYR